MRSPFYGQSHARLYASMRSHALAAIISAWERLSWKSRFPDDSSNKPREGVLEIFSDSLSATVHLRTPDTKPIFRMDICHVPRRPRSPPRPLDYHGLEIGLSALSCLAACQRHNFSACQGCCMTWKAVIPFPKRLSVGASSFLVDQTKWSSSLALNLKFQERGSEWAKPFRVNKPKVVQVVLKLRTNCLSALGFQTFTIKIMIHRIHRLPRRNLPHRNLPHRNLRQTNSSHHHFRHHCLH